MSRILVLGGYGGFGKPISRRLADAGHEVLVAGRSLIKARQFCQDVPATKPVEAHREAIGEVLEQHRPALVVDASGPFQGLGYDVPRACIAAGVHYCDIADARRFVCDIRELDAAAAKAGVTVLSGASSVPALSGAVVRHLAQGLDHVTAVEMAISASNKASAGPSVAQAILGQVGKDVMVWRGKRWIRKAGWQELESLGFRGNGLPRVGRRIVALVDVPDLELVPDRFPGRPACTFKAGTELSVQNRALWIASWLVRWGLTPNLSILAPMLNRLQGMTARLGSDRSAMIVRLFGFSGRQPVERRWTLVASNGDGPEIPSLSIPLAVNRILAGDEPSGARDASLSLQLEDYRAPFADLAIATDVMEIRQPVPPYQQVLGTRFDELPKSLQRMHSPLRDAAAEGEAVVDGPRTLFARTIRKLMHFPPPGAYRVHVHFRERDGVERWTRDFGGYVFSSELTFRRDMLEERFGGLRFAFDLVPTDQGLEMAMRGWSAFGIPLPLRLAPRSRAREWEENGLFHFEVPIALPLVGRIVRYRGWLRPG